MKRVFLYYRNGSDEECLGCFMLRAFTRDEDAVDIDMPTFAWRAGGNHVYVLSRLQPGSAKIAALCGDDSGWAVLLSDMRKHVRREDSQALEEAVLMMALGGAR